ncbi:MAG: hypothetical protein M3235_05620, partial [Actinomycetota bacterium]|nr:hypothetical protein [Actinomycetota bacterium]
MARTAPATPRDTGEDGADPLLGLVGFTEVLRSAGLPVTTERVAAFLEALDTLDVTSRTQTYWAGRLTMCADPDDVARYDMAFEAWFEPPDGARTRIRDERPPPAPKLASLAPHREGDEGEYEEQDGPEIRATATGTEILRSRDMAELSGPEREHLRRLLALLRPEPPSRLSRRKRRNRHGEADPGRTLR